MTALALDFLLTKGAAEGDLRDLRDAWRMDEIEIALPSMAGFAVSPSLGNKLRGALGAVLLESASAAVRNRRPCDWPRTSSAEIFFGRRPLIALGRHGSEIAKPFVFSVAAAGDGSLVIHLRIFGHARERTAAIADALVQAVRGSVRWADMTKDGPRFLPAVIDPEFVKIATGKGCADMARVPEAAEMTFVMPLDAERGDIAREPRFVLQRLLRRLALLAPWQGISLRGAFPALLEAAERVEVEVVEETSVASIASGGHRMANRLSPPMRLRLSGGIEPIWPALVIGEQVHIGRGASLGLGRFRLQGSYLGER
ncbi:MAG: hypothetical protein ACYC3K_16735 [Candidatus Nanopelagicales bacterium]